MVLNAGPVGKLVLLILAIASVYSWSVIFAKWRALKSAQSENVDFLAAFWNSKSIEDVFAKIDQYAHSPIANVFKSGVKELKKFSAMEFEAAESSGVENVNRALARASNNEVTQLEKHVGVLATVANAAPFIGLFGTVFGIIDAFHRIGLTGSANLAVVAPGISEALTATGVGLGAAIPAVVAYNHFAGTIKRMAIDMDCFSQDFLNIIQRSVLGRKRDQFGTND